MSVIKIERWWMPLLILLMTVAATWDAAKAMVTLWLTTDTYMHGIMVIPLAFILAKNRPLPETPPQPLNLWLSIALASLWSGMLLMGHLSMLNVVKQSMLVGVIPLTILLCYGWRFTKHYLAPLSLLFLAVPVGDFMIPFLQSITADMSVFMLQMSGVSVLRNGWYISIAAADFRVAEACSGINFLISTFTVSAFYAFFYMEKLSKRLLFMLLGVVVPVLANGLRVYLIIMIAEWGNVEAATGFDHLVYGWIFFVVVLVALFFIGAWMQDPAPQQEESGVLINAHPLTLKYSNRPLVVLLSLVILLGGLFIIEHQKESSTPQKAQLTSAENAVDLLGPEFPQADRFAYQEIDGWLVYEIIYHEEHTNKKMIGYQNRWFDGNVWSLESSSTVRVADGLFNKWRLADISGRRYQLLFSYCIDGNWESRRLLAKLEQAYGRLKTSSFGGRAFAWFAPEGEEISPVINQQMQSFCKN